MMKLARFFAAIFGFAGTVLLLGSILLCLFSLDEPVKLVETPKEAAQCATEVMEALAAGDFSAATARIYGQPELGGNQIPADSASARVWDVFLDSISYQFQGGCKAVDSGLTQKVSVTALDVASVTEKLQERTHALLSQKVAAATDMAQLYDETNNFRADLIDQVMEEALTQALAQDARTVTREVTLSLIHRDGQWWVVPDEALLAAISGGLA